VAGADAGGHPAPRQLHRVLDNHATDKDLKSTLAGKHLRMRPCFGPTHASWLRVFFAILDRPSLLPQQLGWHGKLVAAIRRLQRVEPTRRRLPGPGREAEPHQLKRQGN
jgi:hypothetical protein